MQVLDYYSCYIIIRTSLAYRLHNTGASKAET